MRLDKYLSNMGLGSRKDVHKLICSGAVSVDGNTVTKKDAAVREGEQSVTVFGKDVAYKPFVYIMMNKPAGFVSSTEDSDGVPVTELLHDNYHSYGLGVAGRLDKDAEGLLILTNDGDYIHRVIMPGKNVIKKYYCELRADVTESDIKKFSEGIMLRDGTKFKSASLERAVSAGVKGQYAAVAGISEGKFHQVKKMFLAVDNEVLYLKRLRIGGLKLDLDLERGGYKEMTKEEAEKVFLRE